MPNSFSVETDTAYSVHVPERSPKVGEVRVPHLGESIFWFSLTFACSILPGTVVKQID